MGQQVREVKMIPCSSSNFGTVVFLVVVFIVMGVLIYHTVEVFNDTNELNEELAACQNDLDQAITKYEVTISECSALQTENSTLMAEISQLRNENNQLRAAQGDLDAEIAALNATIAANTEEIEKLSRENNDLRLENEQLKKQSTRSIEGSKALSEVLQTPLMPVDLETLVKAIMIPLFGEILTIIGIAIKALKDLRRKQTTVRKQRNQRGSPGKNRYPHVIDSHFVDK
jgi:chromosome segregation ATPase